MSRRYARPVVRSIALAVLLFAAGVVLLLTALVWVGTGTPSAWAPFTLGLLCILPGGYHLYIAFQAWRGTRGYDFSDIPEV